MEARDFLDIRIKIGMTQEDLAEVLGKTSRHISRYENGITPIPKVVEQYMISCLLEE